MQALTSAPATDQRGISRPQDGDSDSVALCDSGAFELVAVPPPAPTADLSVNKVDAPDPVSVGATLTYTITATNAGSDVATGVTLTDTLPAGVTLVSASPSCAPPAAGVIVCHLDGLNSGDSTFVEITVTPNAPGTLSNTAQLSANEDDPNSLNNTDTEQTLVNVTYDGLTPTRVGTNASETLIGTPPGWILFKA